MDEIIEKCLDLDDWKHSWHNKFKDLPHYNLAKAVIANKISERTKDLHLLNEGLERIDKIIDNELDYIASLNEPVIQEEG